MYDNKDLYLLSSSQLLEMCAIERAKRFGGMTAFLHAIIDALIYTGVYPKETAGGNPSTVHQMVSGWGAYWHLWPETTTCHHCNADLRNLDAGPPFMKTTCPD